MSKHDNQFVQIVTFVNDTSEIDLGDILGVINDAKHAEVRIVDVDHPHCPHDCVLVAFTRQPNYAVTDPELAAMVLAELDDEAHEDEE